MIAGPRHLTPSSTPTSSQTHRGRIPPPPAPVYCLMIAGPRHLTPSTTPTPSQTHRGRIPPPPAPVRTV